MMGGVQLVGELSRRCRPPEQARTRRYPASGTTLAGRKRREGAWAWATGRSQDQSCRMHVPSLFAVDPFSGREVTYG